MAWSTPWGPVSDDSVIREGLKNRSYEIKKLELHDGIEPGTYSMAVRTAGSGHLPNMLILRKEGKTVASTTFRWSQKISQNTFHTIRVGDHVSLTIGKSRRGSSNIVGIGTLIDDKTLVVPEK